jgi:hypothetical protein
MKTAHPAFDMHRAEFYAHEDYEPALGVSWNGIGMTAGVPAPVRIRRNSRQRLSRR